MIADISITEKSFGAKTLMTGVRFSVDDNEKVGVIGRNGIGKSTLFAMLTGADTDYTGEIIYRRGTSVVATAQEHHAAKGLTVMAYILQGLPEYGELHAIIHTYPDTMGDDMRKINVYSEALERFGHKGFYQIEELVAEELKNFQLEGAGDRPLASLSGGQKRLVEVVKIMHAGADLALIDEPTNHMDYVAKKQFIDWMKNTRQAMLIITHDRDVLGEVDRIIELKDGTAQSFRGNYESYLKQNAHSTGTAMTEFELIERRIANLKEKVLQFRRLKERARDPDTIKQFKRRELQAAEELAVLEQKEKPTFWIDRDSVEQLNYKIASQYDKFKARNIRLNVKSDESRSKHVLVSAKDLALGYGDTVLFEGVNIDLREGEALELRGRNGAGKTTLIRALLGYVVVQPGSPIDNSLQPAGLAALKQSSVGQELRASISGGVHNVADRTEAGSGLRMYDGELSLDPHARVGIYEQEISEHYLGLPLAQAIERMYLDKNLPISTTKIRQLLADYLFVESDTEIPLSRLSGGQKARFQLISMLANDPQLLILDEPTNHLDLPSIEELEHALQRYTGAILYVSHDGYFRDRLGGGVVMIGAR